MKLHTNLYIIFFLISIISFGKNTTYIEKDSKNNNIKKSKNIHVGDKFFQKDILFSTTFSSTKIKQFQDIKLNEEISLITADFLQNSTSSTLTKDHVDSKITHSASFFFHSTNYQPPKAQSDTGTTYNNTTLETTAPGILSNDSVTDSYYLISYTINGVSYYPGETVNIEEGSFTLYADGSYTFEPNPNFSGNVSPITYTITNGTDSRKASIFLEVLQAPIGQDDYDTTDIDTTLDIAAPGVLDNDSSDSGTSLSVISFTINGITYNVGDTANFPEGSFTLQSDGSFIFEPTPGYTGNVPAITYTISDGTETNSANLFLTVEEVEDLIEFDNLESCNQGFGTDGNYKIEYTFSFSNTSTARDYHASSLIENIQITKDFDAIYGSGCVIAVEDINISTSEEQDFVGDPYPLDFDNNSVNQNFLDGTSNNLFSSESVDEAILYPRQTINISYCLVVDPFCGGRPNPTPSGSGIDFEAILNITSSTGVDDIDLTLTDFHTTEAIITAGMDIPTNSPIVNPDGTFDFTNSVIITNEGNAVANNVNFNMGLNSFFNNGVSFNELNITQTSGPPVTINGNYDGDTNTLLLTPDNSLAPGETIVLEIYHLTAPIANSGNVRFNQLDRSQTQGALDDINEDTPINRRRFTYATWEDDLGNHLDRYYLADGSTVLNDQCDCQSLSMSLSFSSTASSEKVLTNIADSPDGVPEHQELTFEITFTNTSEEVNIYDLQLEENFDDFCGDNNVVSFTPPEIISSTATTNPNLNSNFDGISDINIFDGTSGVIMAGETITVEIKMIINENCTGNNTIKFTGQNPINEEITSISTASLIRVLIDNVTVIEGDALEFTISLVSHINNDVPLPSSTPIELTLFTNDGTEFTEDNNTATSPYDYLGISDTEIVIPPDTETSQFTINSIDDNIYELDEKFTLSAEVTSGNTFNQLTKGIGTILDDELAPDISMNNDTVPEGDSLEYTIELSGPSSIPTEIFIETLDFTATSPDDFEAISSVFTIEGTTNPAEPNLSTSFSIPTFEDNLNEPDEEVLDVLGEVISNNVDVEDLTKTGTILDTDPIPLLVISDDTVVEGNTLNFTLTLLNEENEPMQNYLPINVELESIDISTTTNQDFPYFFENTVIPAFQSSINVSIPTINDNLNESTETMYLRALINSDSLANNSNVLKGLGTIKDNDIPNLFTPNDDNRSDVFRIDGLEDFPNFEITIFDRWGGEIYKYSNNGSLNPQWWDGTQDGDPVVEGVYFYIIDYNDGSTKPKTGFIQLMR